MNGDLTDEAIEEGRIAILNLERELKERANDTASVSSNKHHSSTTDERRILDQMPREARLSNREESLGLTVEELDDRGLLDGGGSVPSYVTSLKNKSRRTLELQSRSHRLQGRDKETFTKLLNSFLHMIRTLVRKGLNLDVYCRRHDPNRRGLMRKKAFFTMLKTIGLPFTGRELQDITLHYMVPASDQADYVSLLKDARIVNLGAISNAAYDQEQSQLLPDDAGADDTAKSVTNTEPDSSPVLDHDQGPARGNLELSIHTLVLADVRRMLLESIRSLSKDQDDVYRMFARWDTQGTGTVTATQFLRVLARLHVDISDQDQDFLVELLDTNGMGRIDFEGLIAFCFASTPENDVLSPTHLSGGGSLTEDNINNETMSAVSTEGNTSVDKSYTNGSSNGINSRRPRTATLSRPYNEIMSHAHTTAHNTMFQHSQYYQPTDDQRQQQRNAAQRNSVQRNTTQRGTPSKTTLQRPLTASGRVGADRDRALSPSSGTQHMHGRHFPDGLGSEKHIKTQSLVMEYGGVRDDHNATAQKKTTNTSNTSSNNPVSRGPSHATSHSTVNKPTSLKPVAHPSSHRNNTNNAGPEGEDSQYVVELPDDVMYGEEKYLGSDSARVRPAGVYGNTGGNRGGTDSSNNPYTQQTQYVNSHETTPNNNPNVSNTNHANNSNIDNRYFNPSHPRGDSPSMEMQELHEMGSFNDNTLVTDQEEYFFGSPKEIPTLNNTRNLMNSMNNMNIGGSGGGMGGHSWANQGSNERNGNEYGHNNREYNTNNINNSGSNNAGGGRVWREPDTHMMSKSGSNGNMNTNTSQQYTQYDTNNNYPQAYSNNPYPNNTNPNTTHTANNTHRNTNSTAPPPEPIEHLSLLATQILSTLREIITGRYRRGRSLQEIFEHFDRADKSYFDAHDFVTATADLRIETSARVAAIAVNMIAIDGHDKVSFAEFKVFVLDSDHKLLELNVQEQLAQMLEQKGREYQSFIVDMFHSEEESLNDTANTHAHGEFVSKIAFVSTLQRIGLVLTSSELSRLVDRFDICGNEVCSVVRFVRMVQNSRAWRHAEKVLAYQDEALEEGDYLRQQLHSLRNNPNPNNPSNTSPSNLPQLSEELISMCEYLGIRVLSEPNMVWIAADALKAPLPVSWTAQKDSSGRTYFYNHLNNQTKLEHPLDPHFRKLRDKYRQGGSNETDHDTSLGRHSSALPNTTKTNNNNNNTSSATFTTKSPNSAISFGGIGAALNPAPLNQSLVGTARPQPPPNSFQHLYSHANGEHHFPAIGGGGGGNGSGYNNNVSPSMQMAQDEDEVLYVKYGNMGNGGNNTNPNAKSGTGSGYGQQQHPPPHNSTSNTQPLPRAGSRRPQSALDRTQYSAQQQSQQAHAQQGPGQGQGQGPRGQASAPSGTLPNAASNTPSAPLQGMSTGIYSAELRALMGSAAYNRPVSAPQNHHVQAEKLNAYTEASNRMSGNKQEEHKKNTMELLEAVYTNYPKPLSRHNTNSNTNSNSNMNTMNTISSNINSGGGGMGGRSNSAKWSNNNTTSNAASNGNNTSPGVPTTTHTPLSVVDRAMSIGRSSSHAYQPSRTEQQVFANYNNNPHTSNNHAQYNGNTNHNPHYSNPNSNTPYNQSNSNQNTHYTSSANPNTYSNPNQNAASQPRERSRSANRGGHRAPLDPQTKQARLSEMYDEAILEKLDNAIGIRR